jgi:hypothetical protein
LWRVAAIATLYRKYKDQKDPLRQERAANSKATPNAHGTGQSEAPPSAVTPKSIVNQQANLPAASARANTVTAQVTANENEQTAASPPDPDTDVGDEPNAGGITSKRSAAKIEPFSAVAAAAALTRAAFNDNDHHQVTLLLEYL